MLAFENTGAVARYAAYQQIVYGEEIDPDAAIAALDAVTYDDVERSPAASPDELAIACVGPHDADDFLPPIRPPAVRVDRSASPCGDPRS